MTPDQFWHGDPDDLWAYVSAFEDEQRDMVAYDNIKAYNQGMYFLLAIKDSLQFGKHYKRIYPKEPLKLKGKDVKLSQKEYEEIRKIQLKTMVERFNSTNKSKQ